MSSVGGFITANSISWYQTDNFTTNDWTLWLCEDDEQETR